MRPTRRTLAYNNLQALADENLIESIREHGHWQEGSECIEEHGALFLAAVGRFPGRTLNCMVRTIQRIGPARS